MNLVFMSRYTVYYIFFGIYTAIGFIVPSEKLNQYIITSLIGFAVALTYTTAFLL